MKRSILSAFIIFCLFFNFTFIASADYSNETLNVNNVVTEYYSSDLYDELVETAAIPVSTAPELSSASAVLIEKSTGKILYDKNKDQQTAPASITKIMTMLLVMEAIDSGKLSFYDKVSTSEHAASMGGSQIWLEVGEKMTVHDLMKAVAVGSANDAAVALAEKISGSEEGFVALMNSKAKELGMKNTTFVNACGLDADNQITSAYDVALMSKELIKHDSIKQYTSIWMDSLRNDAVQLVNTNKLVRFYSGTTGLKTGTTDKAGCCLSATASRQGMELIAVVMKAPSSKERFSDAKKLLDYGYANWTITKPKLTEKIPSTINVENGELSQVKLTYNEIQNELIKLEDKANITTKISLDESITAPVKQNTQVGVIQIINGDKVVKEYKITTKEQIKEISFGFCIKQAFGSLFKL